MHVILSFDPSDLVVSCCSSEIIMFVEFNSTFITHTNTLNNPPKTVFLTSHCTWPKCC